MAKRIEVKDVDIFYGDVRAVAGVTLSVPPRSATALIGPSGCGKSSLLRVLNRMHEVVPAARIAGTVLLDGEDIYATGVDAVRVRQSVGLVFQRPNLFPTMSVRDNAVAGLRLAGRRARRDLDDAAEEALRAADLWTEVKDRWHQPAQILSAGQQQRLCIARAIAVRPDVLLMDEPCATLDPISTSMIEGLISDLKRDHTIVFVTHNMQQAARVSDQVAFLGVAAPGEPGRLVECDETAKIFSNPARKATEDFISGRSRQPVLSSWP